MIYKSQLPKIFPQQMSVIWKKGTIPFILKAPKWNKPKKYVQYLYKENYKNLVKKIKEMYKGEIFHVLGEED